MKISVVICTYNRDKYILDALNSVKQQTLPYGDYELIVVNNKCTDNTAVICKKFLEENPKMNIRIVDEMNQGLSFARNRGIKEAKAEIVSYLDDDAIATPKFLEAGVSYLEAHPEVAAVGGKIYARFVSGRPKWLSKYIYGLVGQVDYGENIHEYKYDRYPSGSNMFIRKKLLENVGGFDTDLGRKGPSAGGTGGEERDLFLKLKRTYKQKLVYIPEIVVYHVVDDYRLTDDYIKKLSLAVGRGESVRMRKKGPFHFLLKIATHLSKFGASFIVAFIFLLTGKREKATRLIQVGYWISTGLMVKKP